MLVTPLRDGMNLAAKEFVASRIDNDGVLVLSELAAAASELGDAVLVNSYDADATDAGRPHHGAVGGARILAASAAVSSVESRPDSRCPDCSTACTQS